MKSKNEVIELLSGSIETAKHDDLRAERDRLLELVQNLNIESTADYRNAVKALTTANDTIEHLKSGKSVNPIRYVLHAARNYIIDPAYRTKNGY